MGFSGPSPTIVYLSAFRHSPSLLPAPCTLSRVPQKIQLSTIVPSISSCPLFPIDWFTHKFVAHTHPNFFFRLTFDAVRYIHDIMIKSFRCKDTLALFENKAPKRFHSIAVVAERKLQMLDSANAIADLKSPPGNRLQALRGNRKGFWSIRINDQWRLCFRYEGGDAFDVEIVDYH